MGAPKVAQPFPFFKETEQNPSCCGCNKPLSVVSPIQAATQAARTIHDYGTNVVQNDMKTRSMLFEHPIQIGDSYYNHPNEVVKAFENTVPNYRVGN